MSIIAGSGGCKAAIAAAWPGVDAELAPDGDSGRDRAQADMGESGRLTYALPRVPIARKPSMRGGPMRRALDAVPFTFIVPSAREGEIQAASRLTSSPLPLTRAALSEIALVDLPVDVVVVLEQQERTDQRERITRSARERGRRALGEHVFVKIDRSADEQMRTYVRIGLMTR